MKLNQFVFVFISVLLFLTCSETPPPIAPAPMVPVQIDTVYDTIVDIREYYIYHTDTIVEFAVDTVYEDSVKYSAVDMLEVGVLFAKRELWNTIGFGSMYFASHPAICTYKAQVHASGVCGIFGVRGAIVVLQAPSHSDIGQGTYCFRAGLIYRGEGNMADTASWELREISVWRE